MDTTAEKTESMVGKPADLARKLLGQGRLYDKEFENWHSECKRVTRRYRAEKGRGLDLEEDAAAWFNLYWSSLQTALPSLYARTPLPQVDRRYKDADPVARVAAEILERAVRFEVGDFDFDTNVTSAVLDRLLYGRGVARVYYEPEIEVIDGVEAKTFERVRFGYVQLVDFRHSTARTWEEVTQVSFRSYLGKEEAVKRFGKDKAKLLSYTHVPEALDDERTFGEGEQEAYKKAEVWEVWDKSTRTVIWISPELKDDVLDMAPDPLNLENFFPMPRPLYGTLTNDSLIPVPDARQCRRLYNLLDDISAKIGALTEDLRVAGVYDAQLEEIPRLVKGGDRLIPVRNFAALKAQGGIQSAVEFWPVDYVVNALNVLYQQKEQTKNDIYEVTGWADVMRGTSDPNETAAAQQLKGQFASIRLTSAQNDVQRFCRDLIALMGEVIAEQFEPAQLMSMTGFEFVPGESPEEQQQNYLTAVELLRSEPMRRFRIDIETDSTLAVNEALNQDARSEFMQSLVGALQQIGPLFEQMPAFVPVLGEAINFVARTYKAGRAFEGSIEQAIEQTKQMIAAQGEQPPPPDPKMLEVQGKMQLEQFKAQTQMTLEQQKAEHDMQIAQTKAQLEQEKAQIKALQEMEQTRNAIILEQARLDAEIRVQQAQAQADISINQMKAELDIAIKKQRKLVDSSDVPSVAVAPLKLKRRRVVPHVDEGGMRAYLIEDAMEGEGGTGSVVKRKVVPHTDASGQTAYVIEDVAEPAEKNEQPEGTVLDLREDKAEGEPLVTL